MVRPWNSLPKITPPTAAAIVLWGSGSDAGGLTALVRSATQMLVVAMAEEGGNLDHTRLRPFVRLCKEDSLGHVTRILCQKFIGLQAIKFGLVSTIKLEGTLYLVVPPLT